MWLKNKLAERMRPGFVVFCCAVVAWAVPGMAGDEDSVDREEAKGGKKASQSDAGDDDDKGDDSGDGEAKKVAKGGSAFGAFLPIGLTNEGVTIPSFEGGVRTSLIKAKTMTRIDEDHLDMDDMVIENFFPDGTMDSKITMLRSRYHMPSGVLTSRSRSRVERSDFEVVGDSLAFDTESQRGRMAGNVEMIIYDVKEFGAPQEVGEESASGEGVQEAEPAGAAEEEAGE